MMDVTKSQLFLLLHGKLLYTKVTSNPYKNKENSLLTKIDLYMEHVFYLFSQNILEEVTNYLYT